MGYPRVEVIVEGKEYAIVDRGEKMKEIAVVHWLAEDKKSWGATTNYWNYFCGERVAAPCTKVYALHKATDLFMHLEKESNFIPRSRLEELATLFKDGLIEDGEEEAYEYFTDTCDMDEQELEYFGITNPNENSEEEEEPKEQDEDEDFYPPCGMVDCVHKTCPYICEECDGRSEFEV